MNEHREGFFWVAGSALTSLGSLYLKFQGAINGTLQTAVLLITLWGVIIGLRKVRK